MVMGSWAVCFNMSPQTTPTPPSDLHPVAPSRPCYIVDQELSDWMELWELDLLLNEPRDDHELLSVLLLFSLLVVDHHPNPSAELW